ncbi:MAG: endonuclease/exonuclease/phosphatase family protein [Bacteroidia bacterium]|nr:endonuclease/exonuclease/phosphatase family protein [Bacteroidia bacterium]
MEKLFFIFIILAIASCTPTAQSDAYSIGFYNVENLFDTEDDPSKYDEWFTPTSPIKWDNDKYNAKLENLSVVINQLADKEMPHFLGLCEIENRKVLEDLVSQPLLERANYKIVHFESPDERGIDVAFLYNSEVFKVTDSKNYVLDLGEFKDRTRDILWIKGKVGNGETLHFIVNHWPSRGEGRRESEPKRIAAAKRLKSIKDDILKDDKNAKIIIMGDFNDEPSNTSISEHLNSKGNASQTTSNDLFNPMVDLEDEDLGSYKYRHWWDMLDQIMLSEALINNSLGLQYKERSVGIKDDEWLRQHGSKYEGFPLRTYGGQKYLNGYSDHFPVYIKLIINTTQ